MLSTSSTIKNKGKENGPLLTGAGPYWMGQARCPGLSDPTVPGFFCFLKMFFKLMYFYMYFLKIILKVIFKLILLSFNFFYLAPFK